MTKKREGSCNTYGANTTEIKFSTQAWKPLIDLINLYTIIVAFPYFFYLCISVENLNNNEIH